MAITFVASTVWVAAASTSVMPVLTMPVGWAAGDILVMLLETKLTNRSVAVPAGWTRGPSYGFGSSSTAIAYAAGAGDTLSETLWRVAQAGDTVPALTSTGGSTTSTTGNVTLGLICAFRNPSKAWRVDDVGYDCSPAGTAASPNPGNTPPLGFLAPGDFLVGGAAITLSTAIQTGGQFWPTGTATLATPTLLTADLASSVGADIKACAKYTSVTAGAADTWRTDQAYSVSTYGSAAAVRLREVVAGGATPVRHIGKRRF